ncbi:hypothetical protein WA538_002545 [Blastocystis sp. DL]
MPALNITIVSASDLRETEFFGSKQDPFVIIQTDCDNCKTNTHMDGGKNPLWNENKTISYNDPNSTIEFKLMNENQMKDTMIGTASLPISQVLASGFVDVNLPVKTAIRQCGTLRVIVKSAAMPPQPQQPGYPQQPQQPGCSHNHGYPQQPGYPQQYPPQGYPQQPGYPPQGYPPRPGFPQQGFPQQGFPQQGFPQQYPPQQYPPQQYPPQQYPPQGYPQQPGYPQQYPQQGYPHQH